MNRHEVMYPLQFTRLLGLVDVECVVDAGGCRGQAGAIRYALSVCLKSFVDSQTVEEMQVCGLLTQDIRYRERKKPGQEGARRKFTWKRR
jgi:small subunit ribosomal protein S9